MSGSQIHLAIAGLFGAAGVGLWAWGTHAGQTSASIGAQMLLIHAGALVALTAARKQGLLPARVGLWLTSALALGVALFAGDLAMRAVVGQRLFPMASPIGGVLMMAAWLGFGLSAFGARRD
jgi:uncharacterized membrane protein YgdD (TMEM256/DUF423 family)